MRAVQSTPPGGKVNTRPESPGNLPLETEPGDPHNAVHSPTGAAEEPVTDPLRSRRNDVARRGLLRARAEAGRCLAAEASLHPEHAERIAAWTAELDRLPGRLSAGEARVAFVGAVKSGKSTLVNALVGEDLLPRGSGILTAQVTEVRAGPRFRATAEWKSREEVNGSFSAHLGALGRPGNWDLAEAGHREEARRALATARGPHAEPLRALLAGWDEARHRLAPTRRTEEGRDPATLVRWAGRDEAALYLAGLRVEVPAPDFPEALVLLDCQGADAWNAAHGRDLEDAVLSAHALVYVVSTRVGLREADFRFLEALQGYGVLDLTRFAVNADLGEIRDPTHLRRVVETASRHLRELGVGGEIQAFSALQALLERRMLLDPESVGPGERGLLGAWEEANPGPAAESREAFAAFRDNLWADARSEQEHLVLQRARAELRRTLVEAALALGAAGLGRAAWSTDTLDALSTWAQSRMREAAEARKGSIRQAVARGFSARGAPHRAAWENRVASLDPDPASAWAQGGSDPVAAGAILQARLDTGAGGILAATEPLRINTARNLALEARGELARQGEEVACELAAALARAGVAFQAPPDRRALSREITATRKVPLFRSRGPGQREGGEAAELGPGKVQELLERAGRAIGQRLRGRGRPLATAEAAAQRSLLLRRLGRAWQAYVSELLDGCLLPHVDDAAAQVYNRIASWALVQTAAHGESIASALTRLEGGTGPHHDDDEGDVP